MSHQSFLGTLTRLAPTCVALLLSLGCAGEIVDTVTTDFGDAVATSERTENGDVSTWLQTPSQSEALARLDWRADDGNLAGDIASVRISIDEAFAVAELPIGEMNQLLYALWELERNAPQHPACVGNTAVTCCRDSGWRCRAAR